MLNVDELNNYVVERFCNFGVNKRREVVRLLYEVSKREQISHYEVMSGLLEGSTSFNQVKDYLLARRFPQLSVSDRRRQSLTSTLKAQENQRVDTECSLIIQPRMIYVEERVKDTALVERVRGLCSEAQWATISTYKEYVRTHRQETKAYNQRLETFFLVKEEYEFFLRCPCSPKSVACGYHVMSLGHGCAFECAYCYLQSYVNSPGIRLPANMEDFFEAFKAYKQDVRLGTGQFTDSLIFDHITGYAPRLIEFFRQYPKSTFEFKTKSDNIDLILATPPADNVVVAWSLNPQSVIDKVEFFTASLERRLCAAERCVAAGYRVGFHFDPIIYYKDWARDYEDLVNELFNRIDHRDVAWISLGGLRMTSDLKKTIEVRFPDNTILDETLIPGYDQKLRYPRALRTEIFTHMRQWIVRRAPDVYLYLCMEDDGTCGSCHSAPLRPYASVGGPR